MGSQPTSQPQQPSPKTTIGELRKQYGPHFAKGNGDHETWGAVAGRAGVSTIEEYIKQGRPA